MFRDRYGLEVSSQSAAAVDVYVQGCDRLISLWDGVIDVFDAAIAADPGFALAHAAKARALAMQGKMPAARATLADAQALSGGLTEREASHIAFLALTLSGQAAAALEALYAHLRQWPRDAVVLSTSSSPQGLIGMSGRVTLKQDQVALLEELAPHYGDDWWFICNHAFALAETGQQTRARPMVERSLEIYPLNAVGAHTLAHICYEDGQMDAARAFMKNWLPCYPRAGLLFGHINWHLALCELQLGNPAEAFHIYRTVVATPVNVAPAFITMLDAAAFLWRAELAGHPPAREEWEQTHEFAQRMFPRPGMHFLDWHIALANAAVGDFIGLQDRLAQISVLDAAGHYPSGPVVPAMARAFAALRQNDPERAITEIEAVLEQRDRAAGSLAQTDLFEFTLLKAYDSAGRPEAARRLISQRRAGPVGVPVALVH